MLALFGSAARDELRPHGCLCVASPLINHGQIGVTNDVNFVVESWVLAEATLKDPAGLRLADEVYLKRPQGG